MEQQPIKKADTSVEPEKVLAFETIDVTEKLGVRVHPTNGLTVALQGDEEVRTFEKAVDEYLEEGG